MPSYLAYKAKLELKKIHQLLSGGLRKNSEQIPFRRRFSLLFVMFFLCSSFVLVMVGSIAIADQTAFTDHLNRPTLNQMRRILPLSTYDDADSLEYSERFGHAKSNSLATLISPLAGIAFMAAAAAVAVNPVYLTLTGRKKRDLFTIMSPPPSPNRKFKPGMTQKIQELQVLLVFVT